MKFVENMRECERKKLDKSYQCNQAHAIPNKKLNEKINTTLKSAKCKRETTTTANSLLKNIKSNSGQMMYNIQTK